MLKITPLHLLLYLLTIFNDLVASSKPTGFIIKLIPRDSPESPLYPGNLNESERIQQLVSISNARADYLDSISYNNATYESKNIRVPVSQESFYYIVKLGIGNYQVYLLMDTGSGLTWTQCKPCRRCYNQNYPIYDSMASRTYRKLSCNHTFCRSNRQIYSCSNRECTYYYRYSGGGGTKGILSQERFQFLSTNNALRPIDNVVFGCSNDNDFTNFGRSGKIAGVMGINLEPISLIAQLHSIINRRFSYCLVPYNGPNTASSILRFGSDISRPSGNVQTTRIIQPRVSKSFFYHLNLLDISVGTRRMGFAAGTFKVNSNGGGGCFVDSGVPVSRIDQNANDVNAYQRVISSFEDYFSTFNVRKIPGGRDNLELCYQFSPGFNQYASMTFHFAGANFVVNPQHVYLFNNAAGYFCIALLPRAGKTILGAYQQQNMRLIFDGNTGSLQFVPENCAQDHL